MVSCGGVLEARDSLVRLEDAATYMQATQVVSVVAMLPTPEFLMREDVRAECARAETYWTESYDDVRRKEARASCDPQRGVPHETNIVLLLGNNTVLWT